MEELTGHLLPKAIETAKLRVVYEDKFGDKSVIYRDKRGRLYKARTRSTVIISMTNQAGILIGKKIRSCRIAAGMTLETLARRAGFVEQSDRGLKDRMWAIENHDKTARGGVRMGTLYALAIALGVPVSALLPSNEEIAQAAGVEMTAIGESLREKA